MKAYIFDHIKGLPIVLEKESNRIIYTDLIIRNNLFSNCIQKGLRDIDARNQNRAPTCIIIIVVLGGILFNHIMNFLASCGDPDASFPA